MAFEFRETLTLEIPNVEEQIAAFSESDKSGHGLIIEVAAIHEGLTSNYNYYSAAELEAAAQSWVSPYPKPIILNHDAQEAEPIGRVMAAKMDKEEDGTPYTRLQIAITDPAAIEKVMDQRYLTGSVGGKADEATCNICGTSWNQASPMRLPCKHKRGTTHKGKLAYLEMKNLSFKEYSFVNVPADQRSGVRSIGASGAEATEAAQDDDGWIRPARIFDLNMNKEEIVEYTESENRNVLSGMKKKDAAPLYLQLKGAFLSALAVSESEDKESVVADEDVAEATEEDILEVTDSLSADLATPEVAEEEEAPEEEAPAEEETPEEEVEAPAEEEAEDRPQGQEKPSGDVDPEDSKGAPRNRESEEETPETPVEEAEVVEEEVTETDLSEQMQALESRVQELETREAALSEENAKLRAALKRNLAERVVDTKIALGMHERSERDVLLAEHVERSASSLADSMRDLRSMSPVEKAAPDYSGMPTVQGQGVAAGVTEEAGNKTFTMTEVTEAQKEVAPEDVFVDALMGRRKL